MKLAKGIFLLCAIEACFWLSTADALSQGGGAELAARMENFAQASLSVGNLATVEQSSDLPSASSDGDANVDTHKALGSPKSKQTLQSTQSTQMQPKSHQQLTSTEVQTTVGSEADGGDTTPGGSGRSSSSSSRRKGKKRDKEHELKQTMARRYAANATIGFAKSTAHSKAAPNGEESNSTGWQWWALVLGITVVLTFMMVAIVRMLVSKCTAHKRTPLPLPDFSTADKNVSCGSPKVPQSLPSVTLHVQSTDGGGAASVVETQKSFLDMFSFLDPFSSAKHDVSSTKTEDIVDEIAVDAGQGEIVHADGVDLLCCEYLYSDGQRLVTDLNDNEKLASLAAGPRIRIKGGLTVCTVVHFRLHGDVEANLEYKDVTRSHGIPLDKTHNKCPPVCMNKVGQLNTDPTLPTWPNQGAVQMRADGAIMQVVHTAEIPALWVLRGNYTTDFSILDNKTVIKEWSELSELASEW